MSVAVNANELLSEWVQRLLVDILRDFELEYRGDAVRVDGLRLRRASDRPLPPLGAPGARERMGLRTPDGERYTAIESAYKEPRIRYVASTLENLLASIVLERDGCPVEIDGFRISRLGAYRTDTAQKLRFNLGALSSVCNLDCEFCYRYGSPRDGVAVQQMLGKPMVDGTEVELRLAHHFDGRGLFEASGIYGALRQPRRGAVKALSASVDRLRCRTARRAL